MKGPEAGGSAPLRIGIVGAGNMAATHAEAWKVAGEKLVAIHAPDSPGLRRLASVYEADPTATLDDLLSQVDVVDVCTPTDSHLGPILAAADAGRHVVCEKPLARTVDQAHAAVEACSRSGVRLLVGHVVRFFPDYATAKTTVERDEIGEVGVLRLDRSTYAPAGDNAWFADHTRSGGVILDLMIHDVDYAMWVAGPVTRVYGRRLARRADDAFAILRHSSGAISHLHASWAYPVGTFRTRVEIAGTQGLIDFSSDRPRGLVHLAPPAGEAPLVPRPPTASHQSPFHAEIGHFSEVLRGRGEPRIEAVEALAAVAVCEAAAESALTGIPVSPVVPEVGR